MLTDDEMIRELEAGFRDESQGLTYSGRVPSPRRAVPWTAFPVAAAAAAVIVLPQLGWGTPTATPATPRTTQIVPAHVHGASGPGPSAPASGDVKLVMDLDKSIENRHVLLVEDIVDTGNTFSKIIRMMNNRKPKSLRICTFLSKPECRKVPVHIDFCGQEIPNEFVVGYGLDFAQRYRNLPYVGVLKTS